MRGETSVAGVLGCAVPSVVAISVDAVVSGRAVVVEPVAVDVDGAVVIGTSVLVVCGTDVSVELVDVDVDETVVAGSAVGAESVVEGSASAQAAAATPIAKRSAAPRLAITFRSGME